MSSKRAAITELYKQGQGVNNIARLLKMHKQSVIRAVSRFKELGTLEDRPRSGRPPDNRWKPSSIVVPYNAAVSDFAEDRERTLCR
ncbi:winged helix-turn helix domain-containing protein [Ditylenchus destructor]|uniref:Winged helix-turn helix domain-containing protein n=1 Tax=Ditylenchus destructor TaxID=166010 RepID=A0AAD4MN47_9BILA|nr:winged helix-turn helix domain-containing protein [Ditylenchus destructor]